MQIEPFWNEEKGEILKQKVLSAEVKVRKIHKNNIECELWEY